MKGKAMRIPEILSFLMLFLLAGCVGAISNTSDIQSIPAQEIGRSFSSINNTRIRTSGFLRFGDDIRSLWPTAETLARARAGIVPRDPVWNECITVYPTSRSMRRRMISLNARYVSITGTVFSSAERNEHDSWACNVISIEVESITGLR